MDFSYRIYEEAGLNRFDLPILYIPEDTRLSFQVVRIPKGILTLENFEEIIIESAPFNIWEFELESLNNTSIEIIYEKYKVPKKVTSDKIRAVAEKRQQEYEDQIKKDLIPKDVIVEV